MKTLLIALFLALLLPAYAQQITTATVTITNASGITNGRTITVNGTLRTFTNTVTSAQNQILTATNIPGGWTNLFYAYAAVPQSGFTLSGTYSNVVQFQSLSGVPLTVAISSGWATLVLSTNWLTNAVNIRVPKSAVGVYEQTNVENGLVDYLNDNKMTTLIDSSAKAWSNFLGTAKLNAVSNQLFGFSFTNSLNGTNFTRTTAGQITNFVNNLVQVTSNHFYDVTYQIDTAAYQPATAFQPACATLTNLCGIDLNGVSYIESGTGNILLSNTNGLARLRANENGDFILYWPSGSGAFRIDSSGNIYFNDESVDRFYLYARSGGSGKIALRNDSYDTLILETNYARFYQPISFNESSMAAITAGTVTNYLTDQSNSGSSDTDANSFTVPANTLVSDGDSFTRTIGIALAANSNAKKVQISFNANPVMTIAGVTISGGSMYATVTITRTSSSSYHYSGSGTTGASTPGTAGAAYSSCGAATGVDFTSAITFKLILTGVSSSDLTTKIDNITFAPSANRIR